MAEDKEKTPFDSLADAAERYGDLSLKNYARARGLAEQIQKGFCNYLGGEKACAHLVPPKGAWTPQPHRSGAFSVSGQGFLPLEPISFGLAVRVSRTGDWIRLVLTLTQTGHDMDLIIAGGRKFTFYEPIDEVQMTECFAHLHGHLRSWFEDHANRYEHGEYGGGEIGFDFLREEDGG